MDWSSCFSDITGAENVATIKCFEVVFANLVVVIAGVAGLVFMLMIIWGGFKYLSSTGDPKRLESAKGTLFAAGLGLLMIVGSFIIIQFIETFTNLDLTNFRIQFVN